jgi:hypothetical protein
MHTNTTALSAQEMRQIAEVAYVYGYPLVTIEMTRRVMTNALQAAGARVSMGQLTKLRAYPDAISVT